ncbi:unnamed protein product [Fraxinus pennsylvanica]|uniref:Uncharacterized protein n=1 Tax=Fraxinus pennsylvanica TaxID=56036 RepID=A0AAD2ED24_9LAMI|nr:unnamed protein product [Fraxinus pennsylvanica]
MHCVSQFQHDRDKGSRCRKVELAPKAVLRLQLAYMKPKSLVIAGQLTFPGSLYGFSTVNQGCQAGLVTELLVDVIVRIRTRYDHDYRIYCHSIFLWSRAIILLTSYLITGRRPRFLTRATLLRFIAKNLTLTITLRVIYIISDVSMTDLWHCIKNALGILRVAVKLECSQTVATCVDYLEAVP